MAILNLDVRSLRPYRVVGDFLPCFPQTLRRAAEFFTINFVLIQREILIRHVMVAIYTPCE